MNREILEKPFGPEQIKQREGNFGKMLAYIEGHVVIQRLNDAFDADWSFTILHHEILKDTDEVIVIGELKAGGVVKSQFGSSRITRARETGEILSLSDDLKAATTDALKKAATLLGVGLHIYGGNGQQKGKSLAVGDNGDHSQGPSNGNGGGNGRITGNQYKYMIRLNEDQGHTLEDLNQQCLAMYGAVAQHLSKADASSVIKQLLAN